MSHVDLGFSGECEPWHVESYQFPSKIGGKPAWLQLENLPKPESLLCINCTKPMIFLCQLYAPYEDDDANFHRTVFIFICRDVECCLRNTSTNLKVIRNSLPRTNKFYSFEPPEDQQDKEFRAEKWAQLCHVCGCLANKHCSKCKATVYCSKDHQVFDWKAGHKNNCCITEKSALLFPQYEIVIEPEEISKETVHEDVELEKFKKMQLDGQIGTMHDASDEDLEAHAGTNPDKIFSRFKKIIKNEPEQILRYQRGGQPLWIAEEPKPEKIPNCEYCGADRHFEFQIMPQLLSILGENDLDWGVIIVYSCSQSCSGDESYKNEYVFKQDVELND